MNVFTGKVRQKCITKGNLYHSEMGAKLFTYMYEMSNYSNNQAPQRKENMKFRTVYPKLCDNEDICLAVAEYLFTDVDKKENGKVETIKLGYSCLECFHEVKEQLSKEQKND